MCWSNVQCVMISLPVVTLKHHVVLCYTMDHYLICMYVASKTVS